MRARARDRGRPLAGTRRRWHDAGMSPFFRLRAWRGPSLAMQILALLLGGLVVAQLVTLLLTLLLPPEPPAKYSLAGIAEALRAPARGAQGLDAYVQAGPPGTSGRGWLESASAREDLARLLGVAASDVRLSFYTPLPFAGTAITPRPHEEIGPDARLGKPAGFILEREDRLVKDPEAPLIQRAIPAEPQARFVQASYVVLAQAGGGGRFPAGRPMGMPGAGFPGRFPGAPGGFPNISPRETGPVTPQPASPSATPSRTAPLPDASSPQPSSRQEGPQPQTGPAPSASPARQGRPIPTFALRPMPEIPDMSTAPLAIAPPVVPDPLPPQPERPAPQDATRAVPAFRQPPAPRATVPTEAAPALPDQSSAMDAPKAPPRTPPRSSDEAGAAAPQPDSAAYGGAIDRARRLFGLGPAPSVEGDFVAALRLPNGRWAVVQPARTFLTGWQQRVLLWFVLAFALVAPLGWLFARRLSRPLSRFADAAAQLGRDPSAAIAALDGPAEIGRAAHAFNLMQNRLRTFVDDRTAMVGAISHDLRTPLTRMRFRIEDAPDDVRDGMLQEVDEMEQMISSVLAFIRDASTPGVRERLDLRTLLDDVAEDAALTGGHVVVEAQVPATVEVDVLGMRRVLANLVENAVKYGERARVRLSVVGDEAIAAVLDDGPGLPANELEQVFQPFYRTAAARASGAPGSGLGLAVCRSIARAHGGDVRLLQTAEGFTAEVRVPLSYETERLLAA